MIRLDTTTGYLESVDITNDPAFFPPETTPVTELIAKAGLKPATAVGVAEQLEYTIADLVDATKFYFAIVDQLVIAKAKGLTIVKNEEDSTATFDIQPGDGAEITFMYYQF